jgi:hypothetical protein
LNNRKRRGRALAVRIVGLFIGLQLLVPTAHTGAVQYTHTLHKVTEASVKPHDPDTEQYHPWQL